MSRTEAFLPRFELKFRVGPEHLSAVTCWLDQVMVSDPRYPRGRVNSLYFDTPRLALFEEKAGSDYRKTKVRLRWYGADPGPAGSAFLEVKEKFGTEIRKIRTAHTRTHFAKCVRAEKGGVGIDPEAVAAAARELCPVVPGRLLPVCSIAYERRRFVDPRTGWRVALDMELSVPWVNPDVLPSAGPAALAGAVLEIKGRGTRPRLPDHYLPHDSVRLLPESFSKYGQAVRQIYFNEVVA